MSQILKRRTYGVEYTSWGHWWRTSLVAQFILRVLSITLWVFAVMFAVAVVSVFIGMLCMLQFGWALLSVPVGVTVTYGLVLLAVRLWDVSE